MRWLAGIGLTLLGSALTVYSVPFVSYVALGAFLVGVATASYGILVLRRARRVG